MMFEDAPLDGLKPGKIQGILAYTSERPPIRDYDMEAINGLGFHFTDRQRAVYEEIDRIIRGVRDEPPRIIIESTARGMGDYFERVMEQYLVEMPFNPWHRFNIGGEA